MPLSEAKIIQLPKITDYRGNLTFIEGNRHIPFSIIIDKNGILRAAGSELDIKTELEKILAN